MRACMLEMIALYVLLLSGLSPCVGVYGCGLESKPTVHRRLTSTRHKRLFCFARRTVAAVSAVQAILLVNRTQKEKKKEMSRLS